MSCAWRQKKGREEDKGSVRGREDERKLHQCTEGQNVSVIPAYIYVSLYNYY